MQHEPKSTLQPAVAVAIPVDSPVYIAASTPIHAPYPPTSLSHATRPKSHTMTWLHHGLSNAASTVGLIILHTLSAAFSITAFTFVLTGFIAGVTLLPLMCVGILVFGVFWALLRPLSKVDEYLFLQRKALYTSIHDKMPTNWKYGSKDRQEP